VLITNFFLFLTRVAIPEQLVPQIFYPAKLNLEKFKKKRILIMHASIRDLAGRDLGNPHGKNSYLLLALVRPVRTSQL